MDSLQIKPMTNLNNIPITLTSSAFYLPYLSITLQSIIDTASIENNYDILIIHREISEEKQRCVQAMAEGKDNISIRFVEMAQSLASLDYNFREGYSPESFYRVVMAFVFPNYDKMLYLDCDVIALQDVAELYQIDLDGYLVAAAKDSNGIASTLLDWQGRKSYVLEQMNLDHIDDYFQSGVMLFNLAQIRKELKLNEILDIACAPFIIWGDQDALNIICKNRVKYLDLRWNTIINHKNITLGQLNRVDHPELLRLYLEARQSPAIVHYAGQQPWKKADVDLAEYFWPVARRSPFYETLIERMVLEQNGKSLESEEEQYIPGKVMISALQICKNRILIWAQLQIDKECEKFEFRVRNNDDYIIPSLENALADRCAATLTKCGDDIKNFYIEIPLCAEKMEISFEVVSCLGNITSLPFSCCEYSRLDDRIKNSYYCKHGIVIQRSKTAPNILMVNKSTETELKIYEKAFSVECATDIRRLRKQVIKNRKKLKKPIWLISDRMMSAADNGIALFNYLCEQVGEKADIYFVLSKKSKDFNNVAKIGKVISPDSKEFLITYLSAQFVIFAYVDAPIVYPTKGKKGLRDLLPEYFVYLQHGVIKDDFSHDQNKQLRGINKFVTSAQQERASLLNGTYGYTDSEVILTGLARFDELYKKNCVTMHQEKLIRIAPTWRSQLYGNKWNNQLQMNDYNQHFKRSGYYKFWNSLINDERLLKMMRINGYRGILQLHPVICNQYEDFVENDIFTHDKKTESYAEAVHQTALLVTDYSSAAFDYALCDTPIVYAQFDEDSFYHMQNYEKGYFDYETMGFGPVCYDYESTVNAIIQAIENNCVMEEQYQNRVDDFFAYRDGKNCERIYQEILGLCE